MITNMKKLILIILFLSLAAFAADYNEVRFTKVCRRCGKISHEIQMYAYNSWTDKERFERVNRKDGWMKVPGKGGKLRKARSKREFADYLRKIAEDELDTLMKCWHGEAYGYVTEEAVKFKKEYEDGRVEEGVEWEDKLDSCWGYVVEKGADIDFPKGEDWTVFDETGDFVGEEYEAA